MSITKHNQGFTLIELMIVVAIIGILASVALPSYGNYTSRAKVAEAIVMAQEIQTPIKEFYKERLAFPNDNKQAGVPAPEFLIGNYVKSIEVANGAIHIKLGSKIAEPIKGKILTLRPIVVTGSPTSPISWICGNSSIPEGMEAVGEDRTTLTEEYLPSACRG